MSSDDDLFWNHPNTAFVIFSGATPTILLALMFVLCAGQQAWWQAASVAFGCRLPAT
jgi:hypothetical protein